MDCPCNIQYSGGSPALQPMVFFERVASEVDVDLATKTQDVQKQILQYYERTTEGKAHAFSLEGADEG